MNLRIPVTNFVVDLQECDASKLNKAYVQEFVIHLCKKLEIERDSDCIWHDFVMYRGENAFTFYQYCNGSYITGTVIPDSRSMIIDINFWNIKGLNEETLQAFVLHDEKGFNTQLYYNNLQTRGLV